MHHAVLLSKPRILEALERYRNEELNEKREKKLKEEKEKEKEKQQKQQQQAAIVAEARGGEVTEPSGEESASSPADMMIVQEAAVAQTSRLHIEEVVDGSSTTLESSEQASMQVVENEASAARTEQTSAGEMVDLNLSETAGELTL